MLRLRNADQIGKAKRRTNRRTKHSSQSWVHRDHAILALATRQAKRRIFEEHLEFGPWILSPLNFGISAIAAHYRGTSLCLLRADVTKTGNPSVETRQEEEIRTG